MKSTVLTNSIGGFYGVSMSIWTAIYIYTRSSGRIYLVWNYVEVQERNCKDRLEWCLELVCIKAFHSHYTSLTWPRRQLPVIQDILLQQGNHSRDNTTMTRDILNVQIGVNFSFTHIRIYQLNLLPCILGSCLSKIRKAFYAMLVVAGRHTISTIFLHNLDSVWE